MKKRKFYPRQVLRSFDGRDPSYLQAGERHALWYFMRNSRKMNQAISILNAAAKEDLLAAVTPEQAGSILANANMKIFLKLPLAA